MVAPEAVPQAVIEVRQPQMTAPRVALPVKPKRNPLPMPLRKAATPYKVAMVTTLSPPTVPMHLLVHRGNKPKPSF